MGTVYNDSDGEYSYVGDKGDIGFIDIDNCRSVCSYNQAEESDIVNISVPFPLKDGKPQSGIVGEMVFDSVTIRNTTNEPLNLWSVKIYDSKPEGSFEISVMEPPTADSDPKYLEDFVGLQSLEERVLSTDQDFTVWVSCTPKEIGLHSAAVHFAVDDEVIERLLFVMAEDKISKSLSSSRPYERRRKKKQDIVNQHAPDSNAAYVPARRPSKGLSRGGGFKNRLAEYPIPLEIRDMLNNHQIPEAVLEGLTMKNYDPFFMNLLAMEEIKLEEDMRSYDMENVSMKSRRQLLSLEVPGLAEKRPSLVSGDFIFVKLANRDDGRKPYQGYIHRVEAEEILLKFDQQFHRFHRDRNLYNVQFNYNRLNMRRLYQAVEVAAGLGRELLFPSALSKMRPCQPKAPTPICSDLNEEQTTAVDMIFVRKGGPPYVIHGPPGTGKTKTLIEAILQVYRGNRNARILACAPSNSAADHILERLISEKSVQIQKNEIFRLNALTRPFDDVDPSHIEFCYHEDCSFICPPCRDLARYRIIVSTYTSASVLYSEGIQRGHFSYIFLDEAGQASEPDTMVPVSHLYTRNTVLVLAGDPMQLGPVVFSDEAETHGLGTSYLERLFECDLYRKGDDTFMTKLVRNYRTHQAILHLPSELFYSGELIPCKKENKDSNSWEGIIPNTDFPLLFIGIQGCDEREGNTPSWFNRIEASKTVEIINVLIREKGLKEEEIGVIAPYRKQVSKIREALEVLDIRNVKVGSVEQFQGQEREVIIISTVRSTIRHNDFDKAHYLGFLSNPRRFNVAITRAKALIIIIGNPHIICKDPNWNKLLWYCVDNDSYKGCFLPKRDEFASEGFAAAEGEEAGYGAEYSEQWGTNWEEEGYGWQPSQDQWGVEDGWNQQADIPSVEEDNDWNQQVDVPSVEEDNDLQPSCDDDKANLLPSDVASGDDETNLEEDNDLQPSCDDDKANLLPADVASGDDETNPPPSDVASVDNKTSVQQSDIRYVDEEFKITDKPWD